MIRRTVVAALLPVVLVAAGCDVPPGPLAGAQDLSGFQHFEFEVVPVFGNLPAGDLVFASIDRESDGRYSLEMAIRSTGDCDPFAPQTSDGLPSCSTPLPSRQLSEQEVTELLSVFSSVEIAYSNPFTACVDPAFVSAFEWDDLQLDNWPFACGASRPFVQNAGAIIDLLQRFRSGG